MPLPQLLTAGIENALNQALNWSSNSETLLEPLIGKSCIIYIQELENAVIFRFDQKGITVSADVDGLYTSIPDDDGAGALKRNECWLSVSIFALDKLKQNNQMTKLIKSGQLDFSGDLSILQSLSHLFSKIDIDFEEILSTYVGDAAAYQANTSAKKIANSLASKLKSLSHTFANVALDEKPIGVRPIMLVNFSDDVNELRAGVDRLDARLAELETKSISQNKNNKKGQP